MSQTEDALVRSSSGNETHMSYDMAFGILAWRMRSDSEWVRDHEEDARAWDIYTTHI
jgi:outer membrane usher protein FimD/PapC